jgi:hypothetical protein
MNKVLSTIGVTFVLLAGCVTEEEKKCNELTTFYCAKIVSCSSTASQEKCVEEFAKRIDCSKAEEVPDDFDKCEPAIKSLTCAQVANVFPTSCNIKVRE